jgi:RecA-family ATPase
VEVESKTENFKLERLDELMIEEMPEEQWLIDRVVPSEGFTFIVGAESTGKSFYTLTIADSIVTGKDWLGKFPVKNKTNILFMDKENSRRRVQGRVRGLGMKENIEGIYRIKMPHLFTILDEKKQLSEFALSLSEQVKEKKIGLIIIDSFTDFMLGNENSAEDVQIFFTAMRTLFTTQAILVLHHENKPSQGITRTSSQRVRGSTNITAQLVSGFRVFAIPKTTNEFVLEQFKAGDAEKIKPFKVQLVSKPTLYNPEKTYISEVKWNGEYYDEEGKAELAEELISGFFEENPVCERKELLEYCTDNGIGRRVFDKAIVDLIDEGKFEKVRNGMRISYVQK